MYQYVCDTAGEIFRYLELRYLDATNVGCDTAWAARAVASTPGLSAAWTATLFNRPHATATFCVRVFRRAAR
eukprot:1190044-Prorocentrum_minimum.AAC.6